MRSTEDPDIKGDIWNIIFLTFLYVLQYIPRGLSLAIPFILQKRKSTFVDQAEFSFASYSYCFKLLWAPLVNCVYWKKMGRRKTWLLPIQYLLGTPAGKVFMNYNGDRGDGECKEKDCLLSGSEENVANKCPTEAMTDSESATVDFTVVYNKHKYDISFNSNRTVKELKMYLQGLIGVPQSLQKVMIKGLAKDDQTLKDLDVKNGAKVMVVGSKLDQILAVTTSTSQETAVEEKPAAKEPFCKQKIHAKVLEKGVPDDVMVGIKNAKDALPSIPLVGMLNKSGGKVRLTFKLELDQLWIGTKDRTERIGMNSIKSIVNEPIEGHEEYHIVGFQLGSSEASRYWVYWVPAQYVDSIKNAVLGTWML